MCSECVQGVFRVSSECVQSVFRVPSVRLECVQSAFSVSSECVQRIEVISSPSASSVSFFGIFPTRANIRKANINVIFP